MLEHLLPAERRAGWVFITLLVTSLLWDPLYRAWWIVGVAPLIFANGICVLLAGFEIVFALKDHQRWRERARAMLAIPVSIVSAFLINGTTAIGPRVAARVHLECHREAMAAARSAARDGDVAALAYVEGVPDGGKSIVYSKVTNPERLSPAIGQKLVNGRMMNCHLIARRHYLCAFG